MVAVRNLFKGSPEVLFNSIAYYEKSLRCSYDRAMLDDR